MHQDLGLIKSMSVGENMAMGYGYPRRWKFIDWAAVDRAAEAAVARLGSPLPLDRPVSELSRAEKSIVAIARALVNDPELLVLDEPTASLPEADVSRLFSILFRLRDRGVGIIHVTHRLDEVFRIADALTVLRDGRTVAVYRPVSISPEQLVTDIVGRAPASRNFKRRRTDGRAALAVEGLRVGTAGPVSFRVAARGDRRPRRAARRRPRGGRPGARRRAQPQRRRDHGRRKGGGARLARRRDQGGAEFHQRQARRGRRSRERSASRRTCSSIP